MRWPRRSMFIWQLGPVIAAEGSIDAIVGKVLASGVDGLLIKIAEGAFPYRNTEGGIGEAFVELCKRCRQSAIAVWGWHVPRCATVDAVKVEAAVVENLARRFALDGLILDAEPGERFFRGDVVAAEAYGKAMREVADNLGKPLGICSLALPGSDPSWPERLHRIAAAADVNFPQTYYGGVSSIASYLSEAEMVYAGSTFRRSRSVLRGSAMMVAVLQRKTARGGRENSSITAGSVPVLATPSGIGPRRRRNSGMS